jgi:hypothetical protein
MCAPGIKVDITRLHAKRTGQRNVEDDYKKHVLQVLPPSCSGIDLATRVITTFLITALLRPCVFNASITGDEEYIFRPIPQNTGRGPPTSKFHTALCMRGSHIVVVHVRVFVHASL